MSVIRRNENASQWETVPGSRVPVVVCTARAICISTAKFDYVDDDEVGDIKCFPLFSFSLKQREGGGKGKGVHARIHTYQLRYASFILISNLFQSFSYHLFARAPKILLHESKEDFESRKIRIFFDLALEKRL